MAIHIGKTPPPHNDVWFNKNTNLYYKYCEKTKAWVAKNGIDENNNIRILDMIYETENPYEAYDRAMTII